MFSTILRTLVLYFMVTIAIRLMGKRQIGDLQPNELVVTLLISEIAAIPLQDASQPVIYGVIAIFMLVILEIIISVLSMKFICIRKALSGKSVVVIKNGTIDQKAMKKVRITVLDLIELLRGQNVFDIGTVEYAVLEVNGNLSVLLKPGERTVVNKDLDIKPKPDGMQLPIICDGKLLEESLTSLQVNEKDIKKYLKGKNIKDIFIMTMDRYKNFNVIEKEGIE